MRSFNSVTRSLQDSVKAAAPEIAAVSETQVWTAAANCASAVRSRIIPILFPNLQALDPSFQAVTRRYDLAAWFACWTFRAFVACIAVLSESISNEQVRAALCLGVCGVADAFARGEQPVLCEADMVKCEREMTEAVKADEFLQEKSLNWSWDHPSCQPRVALLRQKTELLGSVDAVAARQEQVAAALKALDELAQALSTATKQWKSASAALTKMQKMEQLMMEKEKLRSQNEDKKRLEKGKSPETKRKGSIGGR